jgi:hypothetical protein
VLGCAFQPVVLLGDLHPSPCIASHPSTVESHESSPVSRLQRTILAPLSTTFDSPTVSHDQRPTTNRISAASRLCCAHIPLLVSPLEQTAGLLLSRPFLCPSGSRSHPPFRMIAIGKITFPWPITPEPL